MGLLLLSPILMAPLVTVVALLNCYEEKLTGYGGHIKPSTPRFYDTTRGSLSIVLPVLLS